MNSQHHRIELVTRPVGSSPFSIIRNRQNTQDKVRKPSRFRPGGRNRNQDKDEGPKDIDVNKAANKRKELFKKRKRLPLRRDPKTSQVVEVKPIIKKKPLIKKASPVVKVEPVAIVSPAPVAAKLPIRSSSAPSAGDSGTKDSVRCRFFRDSC